MVNRIMDWTRFKALIDAYGADLTRWPVDERALAEAFRAQHPEEAHAALRAGAALDRLLDQAEPARVPADLADRIMARFPRRTATVAASPRVSFWRAWAEDLWPGAPAWRPALAFAASMALGIGLGFLGPIENSIESAFSSDNVVIWIDPDDDFLDLSGTES
jgi:hypothetical protein